MARDPHGRVSVWRPGDLNQIEVRFGLEVAIPIPRHWHEEYQFCLIEADDGQVTYRGADHRTPTGGLCVIHPGEIHSNRSYVESGCSFRSLYIEPQSIREVAKQVFGQDFGLPFFPATVIYDREVVGSFLALLAALETLASTLEREVKLQNFAFTLVTRFAEPRKPDVDTGLKRHDVQRAIEYLTAHCDENLRLEDLAAVAGVSAFHFSRLFAAQVGLPPHTFQNHLRLVRSKKLLREGRSISHVAAATGFADQSHFSRHFKRLFGVTPGSYQQNRKIVQDTIPLVA